MKAAKPRYSMESVGTVMNVLFFSSLTKPFIQLPVWLDNVQEASFLCRVSLDGEQSQNHGRQQKLVSTGIQIENRVHPSKSVATEISIGQSSTSKPQVRQTQLPGLHVWQLGLELQLY